jgi:hypothetical protein
LPTSKFQGNLTLMGCKKRQPVPIFAPNNRSSIALIPGIGISRLLIKQASVTNQMIWTSLPRLETKLPLPARASSIVRCVDNAVTAREWIDWDVTPLLYHWVTETRTVDFELAPAFRHSTVKS